MTIKGLYDRISKADTDKICEETIDETIDDLLLLNKEQLLEGKTNKGDDMPSYLSDPYFKNLQSAQAYSDWKDRITPNPKRKKGIANLYIDGTYHNSIDLRRNQNVLRFSSPYPAIERKNPDSYGLNDEKRRVFKRDSTLPVFKKKIEQATGLKLVK